MTTQLLTRLAAVGLTNIPLAWLWMSHAHRLAASQAQLTIPLRIHGFVFYFVALLLLGVVYLMLVEAVAFLLGRGWRKHATASV